MRKTLSKKYLIATIIALLLIIAATIKGIYDWRRFINTPLIPAALYVDYQFYPKHTIKDLAKDLHALGYLNEPYKLIWLAHLYGFNKKLRTGEYRFNGGTKPLELLEKIISGKVLMRSFVIIEGWNFQQVLTALKHAPQLSQQISALSTPQIMNKIARVNIHPEGLFFPATYRYTWGDSDVGLLKWSYRLMQRRLNKEWQGRAHNLPYTSAYEALIAASLIEKETALSNERPLIAAVIINRLAKNMPLQIDPTIIYGLGLNYNGKLHKADLQSNTLYNTYLNKGLPPTPIAIPSLDSIHAALHPAKTDVLYFVAKAKGEAGHQFSQTYQQHERAVVEYKNALSPRQNKPANVKAKVTTLPKTDLKHAK
ncbi:endolytic transglycosylase MltG [soil metagenome]